MVKFNRTAASTYALTWGLRRNPEFPDNSGNATGGDCTNFISQVMLAGGWPMLRGPKRIPFFWWADEDDASWAWSSTPNFSHFITMTRRGSICTRDKLDLGDLMQIVFPGASEPHHMMVVTRRVVGSNGIELYLTAHTTDRINVSMDELQKWRASQDYSYIYWKIAD